MKGIYVKIPKLVDAELSWNKGLKFTAKTGSENKIVFDAAVEHGGQNQGARPMEAVLAALGGCIGMDLVTILGRKKRTIEDLTITLRGERASSEPHVLEVVNIMFDLWSPDVKDEDVRWAVDLSLEKYCSVAAMLEKSCRLSYKWTIHK